MKETPETRGLRFLLIKPIKKDEKRYVFNTESCII